MISQKKNKATLLMMAKQKNDNLLTYGGHLEVLRKMLFKILGVSIIFAIIIFCYKDITWDLLLAPSEYGFITYRWIEDLIHLLGIQGFHFEKFEVELIATDLSSQFMTHVTTAIYLGLLCASPYILYELFKFISPALLENEKKYSTQVLLIVYALFIAGVMMSYFILFPISFRFLGTYNVAEKVSSLISLNSYISTFTSLTLLMGVVFQLPIVIFILAKKDILSFRLLAKYRKVALFIIAAVSAIITPPDIITCILVTLPLYVLYECSIWIARKVSIHK